MKVPRVTYKRLIMNDGIEISLSAGDIVVIVGPNSAGKSQFLRDTWRKSQNRAAVCPVVAKVELEVVGTTEELCSWLSTTGISTGEGADQMYRRPGGSIARPDAVNTWESISAHGLRSMHSMFMNFMGAEGRLKATEAPKMIQFHKEPPTHPIQALYRSRELENRVNGYFKRAFGRDLVVHPHAGVDIPLYVGTRPELEPGEPITSDRYVQGVEKMALLQHEGDGVRSFAGLLLNTIAGDWDAINIDEPEAFLHPPQARQLGRLIAQTSPEHRQLLIATHSGDFLRGVLSAECSRVRVIRITRTGNTNPVRELLPSDVRDFWNDSLLRHTHALDGVFHDRVVICESDSDCRFYSAIADAIETDESTTGDSLFVHCGGKDRIHTIATALRKLGVRVVVAVDFDALCDEAVISRIVSAVGADWVQYLSRWKQVKASVDQSKAELKTDDVKANIVAELDSVKDPYLPRSTVRRVESLLRRSSGWGLVKERGLDHIPRGTARQMAETLPADLAGVGVHVVPVGELEGFCPTVGNHGPVWANEAIARDLKRDPELDAARTFVKGLVS